MAVNKEEFRAALGRFASGVTVVTAKCTDNRPCGMTVSAFSSVSLEPPLILICIDKRSSIHDYFKEGNHFAVNILGAEQEVISRRFASKDEDRFSGIGYKDGITGTPLLDGAIASLECSVVYEYPGGDHTIVVGEVMHAEVIDGRPLTYFRGGYAQLA
jgi:flavin reductase (DIM6/NTAB) family NADH-FMN oxidoreductase RutF